MIYSQVGCASDVSSSEPLRKWHERIESNHQSASSGYFSIFNEVHTVIYELIMAGAQIGEKMVPDISITPILDKELLRGSQNNLIIDLLVLLRTRRSLYDFL